MSAVLLEELLRYAYVLSLLTLTKVVTWVALTTFIAGTVWGAWRLSRRRTPRCTPGVCLRPPKRCAGVSTSLRDRRALG